MKTKFNFNSQICTNKIQSERLLALGLKSETADMTIHIKNNDGWYVTAEPFYEWEDDMNTIPSLEETEPILPAWSLGRLIEIMPRTAIMHTQEGDTRIDIDIYAIEILVSDDPIAEAVSVIEWLIKEGNFNKKYFSMKSIEERADAYVGHPEEIDEFTSETIKRDAYIRGAKEQKAIDEEVRLKKSDSMTQAEYDREVAFADWYNKDGKGTPTYSDAIEWARQELIDKACYTFCHIGCPHKTDSYKCFKDKCDTWKIFRKVMEE